MTKVRFFDPARSYRKIKPEIDAVMQDVLDRGDLILRKDVEQFEENLASVVGTKHAVAVASGTDALILSLKAAGIKPGDRVLAPSYTFRATVEAIHHVGAIPVLYDLGDTEFNADVQGILVAHIAGEISESLESLLLLAQSLNIPLIEDAAQAITAATVRGVAATYSFYPAKILGCYGDGGAVCTNDDKLAAEVRLLRNHCKGDWGPYGYNSRLDNLQAAVLNVKLKHLAGDIQARKYIARRYDAALVGVGLPPMRDVYQDYIIWCHVRDELREFLTGRGIESMDNGYPFPSALTKGPATLLLEANTLRIPCNPDMTDEEIDAVIHTINDFSNRV